jgi:succinoglycan biosynthesis protein ExoA
VLIADGMSTDGTRARLAVLGQALPGPDAGLIARVGLYDEELVRDQDDEHNYRIRKSGGIVLLADDVRSDYYSRSKLGGLWRQYFEYGYWKVRVLQKHPRQYVPFMFVTTLITLALVALFVPGGWAALAGFVGAYLAVNLLASLLTAARRGWHYFFLLPVAFATLHLSFGLGFMVGLARFIDRWGDWEGCVPKLPSQWVAKINFPPACGGD